MLSPSGKRFYDLQTFLEERDKQEKINNILSIKSDNEEYNQIITRLEKGCNDLSRKITQKEDEIRKINCDKENIENLNKELSKDIEKIDQLIEILLEIIEINSKNNVINEINKPNKPNIIKEDEDKDKKENREYLNDYHKQWRENNIDKHREIKRNYEKTRKANDPIYKLISNFRTAIYQVLKENNLDFISSFAVPIVNKNRNNIYIK